MGIHDRGWYRDESGRWGSASEHRGVILLIAVTVALSVVGLAMPELVEALDFRYAAVVPGGQVWRFVTSFLVNPGLLWLLFSMLFFYFLGGEMEIVYGTRRFVTFYLLTGVLANVVKFACGLLTGVGVRHELPDGNGGTTFVDIGTHGFAAPMFATFVLFAFHYPHRPIRIWFLLPIPVWVLVTIYLGLTLLMFLAAVGARKLDGSPSWDALPALAEPLVGAAIGFAYYRTRGAVFGVFDALAGVFRGGRQRRSPADLRVYDEDEAPTPVHRPKPPAKPEPVPQPAGGGVDEHLEAKLDAVLAKVARQGKGSLTAEENDILLRASEVFKRKRR